MPFGRRRGRGLYLRPDRVERVTLGSHIPDGARGARQRNWRPDKKDAQIDGVLPATRSYQGGRRTRSNSFALHDRKSTAARRALIVVALVVVIAVVGVMVGVGVYKGRVDARMSLGSQAPSSLVAAPSEATSPYYTLFVADLDGTSSGKAVMAVRVDPGNRTLTVVSVPGCAQVGAQGQTSDIVAAKDDATLVSEASDMLGVSFAHFVKTDAQSLSSMVDVLGGVDVTLAQDVDDPDVGSDYLRAGKQRLSGAQVVEASLADNYTKPEEMRETQQRAVLLGVLAATFDGTEGWDFLNRVDAVADGFKTDMGFDSLQAAVKAFGPFGDAQVLQGRVPGTDGRDSDGPYFTVSSDATQAMMSVVDAGGDPSSYKTLGSADPSQVTVTVRNGAGTTGGASKVSDELKAAGYQVPASGNTDSYVYDQTLVVYKDDDMKSTAEAICDLLGCGRTVSAGIYYSFDTDVEVIIGKDWAPNAS